MNSNDIKKTDKEKIVPTYNRYDMVIDSGKGALCVSKDGKSYIDFTAGIGVNSLGFCDDKWVEAVTSQLKKVQHSSNLFYTEPQVIVADILTKRTGLSKVFFGNSGAEANEAAIKAAKKYGNTVNGTGCNKIITLKNSFHGRTMATITATGQEAYHKFFMPFIDGFEYCEPNNASMLEELAGNDVCAVMMEVIQGEGGVIALKEEFVKAAAELCRKKDILLIIDEVQSGIGRTGRLFAYENYGIEPDIVTFAKGIGGGLPIGGAMFGKKCCDILGPGDHGTTYGGNPVACAGALEVLKRLNDDFLEEVEKKGNYLKEKLLSVSEVEAVSGMGLMLGASLKEKSAADVVKKALEYGVMTLTAKEKIRLLPPLTISYDEIDRGVELLKKALK